MKRRLTIRTRLVLLLMLPLLALLALAAFAVSSANERSQRADEAVQLAENPGGPGDVIRALQAERAVTERYFLGLATADEVNEVRASTEAALQVGIADLSEATADDQAAYGSALASYAVLPELRDGVFTGDTSAAEAWEFYRNGIRLVFDANAQTRTDVELAEIRSGLDLLSALEQANEGDAALKDKLGPVIELGEGPADDVRFALQALATERQVRLEQISSFDPTIGATVAVDPSVLAIDGFLADVLATPEGAPIEVDTDAWEAAVRGSQAAILSQSDVVVADIVAEGDAVVDEARTQQLVAIGAAIATVVIAVLLVFVGTRSIVRPLRRLTSEARAISNERLPEAVEQVRAVPSGTDIELPELPALAGQSTDEIGQVGDAIDRLQHVALDLAVEQAVLRHNVSDSLLNLARRTQSLAGRQLDELTELEEQETDPDALEKLFRLDHLTTRIRRHAESLIVLAGNEGPRSRGDAASIGDVLRAALGEVEDYQRVEFGPVDEAIVHGHAIADLAHLLAELLENGLQFSPPDQPVGIVGRLGDDVYRIAIVDCGVGLTDDELDEANARLRGEELPTVAPSRYLGLYVAARLAGRLGATVQLSRATTGGVLADVLVPRTLVLAGAEANLVEPRMPPPSPVVTDVVDGAAPESAEVMKVPGVPPSLPYDPAAVIGDDDPLSTVTPSAPTPVAAASAPVAEPAPAPVEEVAPPAPPAQPTPPAVPPAAPGGLPQRRRVSPAPSGSAAPHSPPPPPPPVESPATAPTPVEPEADLEPAGSASTSIPEEPEGRAWMNGLAPPVPDASPDGDAPPGEPVEGDGSVEPAVEAPSNGAAEPDAVVEPAVATDVTGLETNGARPGQDQPVSNGNGNGAGAGAGAPTVDRPGPAPETEADTGTAPLAKRVRGAQLPQTGGRFAEVAGGAESLTERDADSVRDMLSRFQSGVRRGREVAAPIDEETSDE